MKNIVKLATSAILWVVAVLYAYGVLIHVLNILSLSGFAWIAAPTKWQILDISYLLTDSLVLVGLPFRRKFGFFAFYVASLSQLLLYTVFREWIMAVPAEFAVSGEQQSDLRTLVIFHCVTLILVSGVLWGQNREPHQELID